jgi:hypothetical protein
MDLNRFAQDGHADSRKNDQKMHSWIPPRSPWTWKQTIQVLGGRSHLSSWWTLWRNSGYGDIGAAWYALCHSLSSVNSESHRNCTAKVIRSRRTTTAQRTSRGFPPQFWPRLNLNIVVKSHLINAFVMAPPVLKSIVSPSEDVWSS